MIGCCIFVVQETHCVTFKIFVVEQEATNSSLSSSSARLNVYLKDNNMGTTRQPVWNSDHVEKNSWITIQLALTPRAYQVHIAICCLMIQELGV